MKKAKKNADSLSSSHSIMTLGLSEQFWSQHSPHLAVLSVVVSISDENNANTMKRKEKS
jgi:hypothetical protein